MQRHSASTFGRFLTVPENHAALAAVERVLARTCSLGSKPPFNPLYLHGPSGAGKTALVSALIEELTRRSPDRLICLCSANDFQPRAAPGPDMPSEGSYSWDDLRGSDLAIVEDIQHLPSAAAQAFAGLFDDLARRQTQMILTANVGPRRLTLPARLTSRLASGLVVALEPLQSASRLSLLQDKAQRRQLAVNREILAWLAEHLTGGGRQLDGAVAGLELLSRLRGRALDVATAAEYFQELVQAGRPTVERIARAVSSFFQLQPRQLQSGERGRSLVLPRQIALYLARKLTGLSLEQIGHYFGRRDHSTVLHACRKVEQALAHDAVLSGTVRQLQAQLA